MIGDGSKERTMDMRSFSAVSGNKFIRLFRIGIYTIMIKHDCLHIALPPGRNNRRTCEEDYLTPQYRLPGGSRRARSLHAGGETDMDYYGARQGFSISRLLLLDSEDNGRSWGGSRPFLFGDKERSVNTFAMIRLWLQANCCISFRGSAAMTMITLKTAFSMGMRTGRRTTGQDVERT